ncbi:MAG: hypothetical protein ACFFD2_05190 [Promethearchaeota archaeon]
MSSFNLAIRSKEIQRREYSRQIIAEIKQEQEMRFIMGIVPPWER